jgi:hypothetical protein
MHLPRAEAHSTKARTDHARCRARACSSRDLARALVRRAAELRNEPILLGQSPRGRYQSACTVAIDTGFFKRWTGRRTQPRLRRRPLRSFIQVDPSFEGSVSSRRAAVGKIDRVDRHHRKRARGSRESAGSVLDRRSFGPRNGIWWHENTFTQEGARQLIAVGRNEGEFPSSEVSIDLSRCSPSESAEVGRCTLNSPPCRRGRNLDDRGVRTVERQIRAASRLCLTRPQACARGRRQPEACARGRRRPQACARGRRW